MLNIVYYVDSKTGDSQIRDDLLAISKEAVKARISAVIVHVAENNGKTSAVVTKNIRG